jgi:hypothetical protein
MESSNDSCALGLRGVGGRKETDLLRDAFGELDRDVGGDLERDLPEYLSL